MKFDYHKVSKGLQFVFLETVAHLSDINFEKLLKEKKWHDENTPDEEKTFDIKMSIDGYDVNFSEFFTIFEKNWDETEKQNKFDVAREVFKEHFQNVLDKFNQIEQNIDELLDETKWNERETE